MRTLLGPLAFPVLELLPWVLLGAAVVILALQGWELRRLPPGEDPYDLRMSLGNGITVALFGACLGAAVGAAAGALFLGVSLGALIGAILGVRTREIDRDTDHDSADSEDDQIRHR